MWKKRMILDLMRKVSSLEMRVSYLTECVEKKIPAHVKCGDCDRVFHSKESSPAVYGWAYWKKKTCPICQRGE